MSDSPPNDDVSGVDAAAPRRRSGRHRQRSNRLIGLLSVLTLLVISGATAGLLFSGDDGVATESTADQQRADDEAGRGAPREAPGSTSPTQESTKDAEETPKKKRLNEAEVAPEPEPSDDGESAPKIPADCDGYSGNRAIGCAMLGDFGFGMDQMECLDPLWDHESGWDEHASNSGSGAYGIPQALPGDKMASSGGDWQDDPATQIDWGLGYIKDRYQDPCGAWSFWQSNNYY